MKNQDTARELLRRLAEQLDVTPGEAEAPKGRPLSAILAEILADAELGRSTTTQYLRSERCFAKFLGRETTTDDLTHDNLNCFLAWLTTERRLSGYAVKGYRRAICRIWNRASLNDECAPYNARKIKQPKCEPKRVRAWAPEQVAILLEACKPLSGTLNCGLPASIWLRALILVAYDTGLRPSDLRKLKWSDVDLARGTVILCQNKTGNMHTAAIGDESIKALRDIVLPARDSVFVLDKWGIRRWELILFEVAEPLGFRRDFGQALGTLRKTHATEIFREHGLEAAAQSLGHVGGSRTAKAHYVDSAAMHVPRLPRSLFAPSDASEN